MRIAFVTNNYRPYGAGVVQSIDAITHQLREMGHEVMIIAPQFLKNHDDPEYVMRIPSIFRFIYKKKHMAVSWRAKYYLKNYLTAFNPDTIHVHHPFWLGQLACRVAREMGVPVFFTYHTLYEDYVHYLPLPALLVKPLVTKQVLNFCASVDHIIAPSSGIQYYLKQNGIADSTVIASPFRPEFDQIPAGHKQLIPPYQLLCVSRFTTEKNLFMLFDVLVRLPAPYHLTLVGYGDLEHELRRRAQLFEGRVQFIINPPIERLLRAYQQAHLFLFPSQTDTQGIVLAESMATGTPVVALDGIGQRDIIKEGENGYIVTDAAHMALTIEQVLNDPMGYSRLQQHARGTVGRYGPQQSVRQLVAAYKSLQ